MPDPLREKLIKLAHAQPELRKDLLPILKQGGPSPGSLAGEWRKVGRDWEVAVTKALVLNHIDRHKPDNPAGSLHGENVQWRVGSPENLIKLDVPGTKDGQIVWESVKISIEAPMPGDDTMTVVVLPGPRKNIGNMDRSEPKHVARVVFNWLQDEGVL